MSKSIILVSPAFSCFGFTGIPASFFMIAGYTPAEVPVNVLDENLGPLDGSLFKEALVGITAMTCTAERAIEISKIAKENGAYGVVFGGPHATICPDEMKKQGTVILGEIEGGSWTECVQDYLADKPLKSTYSTPRRSLSNIPLAPRHIYEQAARETSSLETIQPLETGRGCPFNCAYCSANLIAGSEIRYRPILEVVREVRARVFPETQAIFVTDNNFGLGERDIRLLRALEPQAPLRIFPQVMPQTVGNDEFLEAFKAVGGRCLMLGVETPSVPALREADRLANIGLDYERISAKLHSLEVEFIILLMFGFDSDTPDTFPEMLDFVERIDPTGVMLEVLTPYPGTETRRRLEREGRILSNEWSLYDTKHLVYRPELMSPEEFEEGFKWLSRACTGYYEQRMSSLQIPVR